MHVTLCFLQCVHTGTCTVDVKYTYLCTSIDIPNTSRSKVTCSQGNSNTKHRDEQEHHSKLPNYLQMTKSAASKRVLR